LKITITKLFQVLQESTSPGRVILPASCEASEVHSIVTIEYPYGSFKITSDRFRELVNDEAIEIVEA
jgi:hypothetical protein